MISRFVTLATETVEWQSTAGSTLRFVVELVREETDHGGNIGWRTAPRGLSILQALTIDGVREHGILTPVTDHPVVVAKIGRVGLKADRYSQLRAAIAAVEAHPEYVAELAARAEGLRVMAEHEEHVARVENMMTLGGRTF